MKKLLLLSLLTITFIFLDAQSPGNSLHFDGNDDLVSCPLPSVFLNVDSNDITMEVWIKPMDSNFCRVVFAEELSTQFMTISLGTNRQVFFYVNNSGGNNETTTFLPHNQWTHVACTWQASSQTRTVYFNGVAQPLVSGGTSSTGTPHLLYLGSRTNGAQYFKGELDEVRIWDVARSQCEISGSMNSEVIAPEPNLVAYYNFNQGTAGGTNTGVDTLPDFTTNHDGMLTNFTLSGSFSNWLASGAVINSTVITNAAQSIDSITACSAYTWINSVTYTSSNNTAKDTLLGGAANGCDSVITLNLTITGGVMLTDTHTACNSFLWMDGNTYTSSNNSAQDTLPGSGGCDTIVTLNLTLTTVDTSVTTADPMITSNATGVSYQWLDCGNSYAVIAGETAQSFWAPVNGSYAVEITDGACVDTSACVSITSIGLNENIFHQVKIYPNPSRGLIHVDLGNAKEATLKVYNMNGQLIFQQESMRGAAHQIELQAVPGLYIVELIAEDQSKRIKLFIQ